MTQHAVATRPPVALVVLAAGEGKRMGKQKLLLPFRGRPLLSWTLDLVEGLPLSQRLLVLGADANRVRAAFDLQGWQVVVNDDWPRGMGSSLRRAAEVVDGGMLVFLGDMPWVPEGAARAVLARAHARPIAPSYRGVRGFPVYLPAGLRPKLLDLCGDVGARNIIGDCELIPWDDPGVIRDVDTEVDLTFVGPKAGKMPALLRRTRGEREI